MSSPSLAGGRFVPPPRKPCLRSSAYFRFESELILCYDTIRDDVEQVISCLSDLTETYPRDDLGAQKPVFYGVRDQWNQGVGSIHDMTPTQRAQRVAQMIFLNKTCFNGLYRVNRSGLFNTPIGRYSQPGFTSPEKLRAVSTALAGVQAHHGSFEACKSFVLRAPLRILILRTAHFPTLQPSHPMRKRISMTTASGRWPACTRSRPDRAWRPTYVIKFRSKIQIQTTIFSMTCTRGSPLSASRQTGRSTVMRLQEEASQSC